LRATALSNSPWRMRSTGETARGSAATVAGSDIRQAFAVEAYDEGSEQTTHAPMVTAH